MHYVDHGQGPPVVMVHGNPSWSFYFRSLIDALAPAHRCLVPDHIGMGLSDKPGDDRYQYTLASRIADLSAWLDHCVPSGQVDLIVHDWGGAIGFGWAVAHPERVRRIVLLNTAVFSKPEDLILPWPLLLARQGALGAMLVQGLNAFARGAAQFGVGKKLKPTVRAGLLAPYDSWSARRAVLRFVQDIPVRASDPAYGALQLIEQRLAVLAEKPMLMCWGGQDFVFNDRILARFRDFFPRATVVYFPEAGHYVLEDEAEAICARVSVHLQKG